MAFPTIPTVADGRVLTAVQANTTPARTFPNLSGLTKNAGDRLIAICIAYQTSTGTNAAFSGWTSGWTERHDSATSTTMAIGIAEKISTGSETGTISVTQAGTITGHAVMILLSIPGAHASTPIEVGSRASGTTAEADPASFAPAGWGAEDTLWISVRGSGETSTTGSYTGISAAPTNYTDGVQTGISADAVGGVEGAVAFRQLNASSEDVGPGTSDLSNARNAAVVIAVRGRIVYTEPLDTTITATTTHVTKDKIFFLNPVAVTTEITTKDKIFFLNPVAVTTDILNPVKRRETVDTTVTSTTTFTDIKKYTDVLDTTIACTTEITDEAGAGNVPDNVVATATGASTMTVTWDAVDEAIAYDIERNGVVIVTDHPASPFNDTGLSPTTEYTYRVRSVL